MGRGSLFTKGQRKRRRNLCIALNRVDGLSYKDRQKERQRINQAVRANGEYDLPPGKPKRRRAKPAPPPQPVSVSGRSSYTPETRWHSFFCMCPQCRGY